MEKLEWVLRARRSLVFFMVTLATPSTQLWACPSCYTSSEFSNGNGYLYSIVLMMMLPALLLGGLFGSLFWLHRRRQNSPLEASQIHPLQKN